MTIRPSDGTNNGVWDWEPFSEEEHEELRVLLTDLGKTNSYTESSVLG